jgi:NADPH:quinone reductase
LKAVQIVETGGPEVLHYLDVPTPQPGPGEVVIKSESIGVGNPEIMVRKGTYPWMPPLPAVVGIEMAGRIAAIGDGVQGWAIGDGAFFTARETGVRGGCYAEFVKAPADVVYKLPAGVDLDAAACLCNYQVAWHLLHTAVRGASYNAVLVWAASGGVGVAITQLAKLAGCTVIGIANGPARVEFVRRQGADHCIDRSLGADLKHAVSALTGEKGVDLILDPVGGADFHRNFELLNDFGTVVSYGTLAGPVGALNAQSMRKNSGPSIGLRFFSMHSLDKRPAMRRAAMEELVPLLEAGKIKPPIFERMPLSEARRAHTLFESGKATGKILLKPEGT